MNRCLMKEEMLCLSRQCHGNLRSPRALTLDLMLLGSSGVCHIRMNNQRQILNARLLLMMKMGLTLKRLSSK